MKKKIESFGHTDSGHGRVEERRIEVLSVRPGSVVWPDLRQICRITRTRYIKDKQSTDSVFAITSLHEYTHKPKDLLELNRAHWAIENNMNWVKDNILNEDKATNRTRKAPHTLAEIRNFIPALAKKYKKKPKEFIESNQMRHKELIKTMCYQ